MKGIIMAGGRGTRLRPLTCNLPKPLVPILNRPVMEYSIELLKRFGIREIAVTLQYLSDQIIEYFGDGSKYGVKLHYFVEENPLGTAGSLKNAATFLDDTFVVLSADTITNIHLDKAIEYHQSNDSLLTIITKKVSRPEEFGIVFPDDTGKVLRFIEKPLLKECLSDQANTGVYIAEPSLFDHCSSQVPFDVSKDLIPMLLKRKESIYAYEMTDFWYDIGSFQQYRKAQKDLLKKKYINGLYTEVCEGVWIGKNTKIHPNVKITPPVLIDANCIIEDGVEIGEYSVIGEGSIISTGASIKRSILWDHVYVAGKTEIRGAIISSKSRISRGARIYEGATVGSNCVIEKHACIQPKVRIWPDKHIHKYAQVHSSIMWGESHSDYLFQSGMIVGCGNREITPEKTAEVALAFASKLRLNGSILLSTNEHLYSSKLKNIIKESIHFSGVNTIDIGVIPTSIARTLIRELNCDGGVFIKTEESNGEVIVTIQFFGGNGHLLDKNSLKKLASSLSEKQFRRTSIEYLGIDKESNGVYSKYVYGVLNRFSPQFKATHTAIGILFVPNSSRPFIQELIKHLPWEIFLYDNLLEKSEKRKILQSVKYDLAYDMSDDLQNYTIYLPNEVQISDLGKQRLLMYMKLMSGNRIEGVSSNEIATSSTEVSYPLKMNLLTHTPAVKELIPTYEQPDAIHAFLLLFQLYCENIEVFYELLSEDNPRVIQRTKVKCLRDLKGKVFRMLMEDNGDGNLEWSEGIKFFHSDYCWTHIISNDEYQELIIYSQAETERLAREFTNFYVQKIQDYQKV